MTFKLRKTSVPGPRDAANFISVQRAAMAINELQGVTGDPAQRAVRVGELKEVGLLDASGRIPEELLPASRNRVTFSEGASEIKVGKTVALLGLLTSVPARVRLYCTDEARTADELRPYGDPYSITAGVILDVETEAPHLAVPLSPAVVAANMDLPNAASVLYALVEPTSDPSVVVRVAYIPLES